ncbi:hypothetical protein [Aggregatilinea lenta]|uniref:hypothetical protein n=1 Tax=Aggregatilinea lenta TaxID=913108 RepID=UPI000E5A590A|nr:hypothetical protein [Aggregatilinea lenta]
MPGPETFQLQRLYFGTLVAEDGRVSPTPGVIARTGEITPAHVAECLRVARLAPPLPGDTGPEMPGAFGVFRGESIDFVLAKAQRNDAGYPQLLFILTPVAALRALEGNASAFQSLALMDMPSFASIRRNLVPFELHRPTPSKPQDQADLLLDLLMICQDSYKTLEGLLSALIEGQSLAIVNSPVSAAKRLQFVQALLGLLPVPARVTATFATYVNAPQASPAQIKFLSSYAVPDNHVVFDWDNAKLLTAVPQHPYSTYIVRQLRLDASIVVRQTHDMARTAVWRTMHRENLSTALNWVSRRAAIDQTVRDGMPVDRKLAASVLREDPTLPPDLRQIYARHLIGMALAVGDLACADVIPAIAVSSDDLASNIAMHLQSAIQNGQAESVYALLQRWILGVPDTLAAQWQPSLQAAAKARLQEMLARGDVPGVRAFLGSLKEVHPSLGLEAIIPEMIAIAQPATHTYAELANAVFLLSAQSQPAGDFQRLLADAAFTKQLPDSTRTAVDYLSASVPQPILPHVLDYGARVYGEAQHATIMARFIEWAVLTRKIALIDTQAMQALLTIAQSSDRAKYATLIQHVVSDFSQPDLIAALEPPGPRVLVQLLLQTGSYGQAMTLLETYQSVVFHGDRFPAFTELAGEIFATLPLPAGQMQAALAHLEGSQIRPEPRTAIFCGALLSGKWSAEHDYAARRLTTMVFNDNHLIEVIGYDYTLKLLALHSQQRNALDALRVGASLVDHILATGADGAVMITRMWPHITWDPEVSDAALELLRRYIRGVRNEQVPVLLASFTQSLRADVGRALQASWLMRLATNNASLMRFSESVHTTARLLLDLASTYHADKELPPNHRIRRDLDQMTGGLSEAERARVADNLFQIMEQVYDLHSEAEKQRKTTPHERLVRGEASPQSGLDLLRFVGGQFADHRTIPLKLERESMAHLFGTRSAAMFLRETDTMVHLLEGLNTAYKGKRFAGVPPVALASELDSLWGTLSLYNQRRVQEQFAADCQNLAAVIDLIADSATERVLGSSGLPQQLETGQRQPRNALEALRWIHGYFARKHRTRT